MMIKLQAKRSKRDRMWVAPADNNKMILNQSADENHSMCGNCQDYRHQISNIMTLVNEIKTKQVEGTQQTESESAPQNWKLP